MSKPMPPEIPTVHITNVSVYKTFRSQHQGRLRSYIGEDIRHMKLWDMIVLERGPISKKWPADFARRWNTRQMKASMNSKVVIKAFTKHGRIYIIRTQ